jgi:hypothetical protein
MWYGTGIRPKVWDQFITTIPDLARSFEALKSSLRLISFSLSSPSVPTRAGREYPRDWILPHLPCFFSLSGKFDT